MVNGNVYDDLCDKLELYVDSILDTLSENKFGAYASLVAQIKGVDPRTERLETMTESIAATWSETLRWAYKERGEITLRDCLLPEELGRASSPWNSNLSRFGLNQEQVENLLRKFGQQEITDCLELPWGGYVTRSGDNYKLCGPEK